MVVRSVFQAVDTLRPFVEDLGRRVADAGKEGLDRALDEWVAACSESDDLGSMITRPMVIADLGGQLMVHAYESQRAPVGRIAMRAGDPLPFFDVPWTEAIELYKASNIPREKEFLKLIESYSDRSGEAKELLLKYLRDKSKAKILEALEEGRDVRQYIADMNAFCDDLGVSKENPAYLETVFRTNTHTAYGAGRWRAMTDPDVIKERPYAQYRTCRDGRVRDEHRALDGLIFRKDDPQFARIAPPNGYNCRCSVVSYTPKPGEEVAGSIPSDYIADDDFDQAPDALVDEALLPT